MANEQNNNIVEQEYFSDPDKCVGILKHTIMPDGRLRLTVGLFELRVGSIEIEHGPMLVKLTTDKPSHYARQILAKFNIHTEYSFTLMTPDGRCVVYLRGKSATFANEIAIPMDMAIDIAERVLDFCNWKVTMKIIYPPKREDIPRFQFGRPAEAPAKRQKTAPTIAPTGRPIPQ